MRVALLVLALATSVSHARPARLTVTSGSCTDLGDQLASVSSFVTNAAAAVRVVESDLTATITLDDGDGHTSGPRVVHADSCSELASAVGIVISIALPAIAAMPDLEPVVDNSNAMTDVLAALKLQGPVPQASDPEELVARAEVPRPSASQTMIGSLGISSAAGPVASVALRWRWNDLSLAGEVSGSLPQDAAQDHVSIERMSAALVRCRYLGNFGACGVVRVGIDHGTGTGLVNQQSATAPLIELAPRITWEHPLTDSLAIQLQAELDVSLTSAQFDVDHMAVWSTSRFAGLAGGGLVMRFP